MAKDIPDDIFTPHTAPEEGVKAVLILTDDSVEDLELYYPYYRFVEEGCRVDVATPDGGDIKGKTGYKFRETLKLDAVDPEEYDLLYIPGGKAPAKLKSEEEVLELVRVFAATGKPIAALCHGPQVLAKAGVINGAALAAWPEVRDEIEEAGAAFVHQSAQVDGQFITGRWPADLPSFMPRVLAALASSGPLQEGEISRQEYRV